MPASPPYIPEISTQSPDHLSLIFPLKHTEVLAQISANEDIVIKLQLNS